jgi:hypothetical protein
MNVTAASPARAAAPAQSLRDTATLTRRILLHWKQRPVSILLGLLFPVLMVVTFGYLFGGAMAIPKRPRDPRAARARRSEVGYSAPGLVPGQEHAAGKRPGLHQVQVHPVVRGGFRRRCLFRCPTRIRASVSAR